MAASSHLSGKLELFMSLHNIPPVTIKMASGDSFTANQQGTIHILITADLSHELPAIPITLTDIIYVPRLKANLLSVGQMTNSNVNVIFRQHSSSLTLNSIILVHGPKVDNLFTYCSKKGGGGGKTDKKVREAKGGDGRVGAVDDTPRFKQKREVLEKWTH